ncbi:MAG: helicase, partial [Dysgonamonadaceae bacterium]|nr:helicase [Dysgonamonadaceae bacterium]
NEKNPIIIPREEVRFWVRKINPVGKDNIHLRTQMAGEIPHFLHFLLNRKLSTRNESRMWFTPDVLETPALQKIKKYNTNKIEMEMAGYCRDIMERLGQDSVCSCRIVLQ